MGSALSQQPANVHPPNLHTSILDVSDLGELHPLVQPFAFVSLSMVIQNFSCVYHLKNFF